MARRRRFRWSFVTPLLAVFLALSAVAPPLTLARQTSDTGVHGINPADMDFSADPAEDFYQFANGGWLDRTEIPADHGRYGVFNELGDLTRTQLLDLLNEVAASDDLQEGSDAWKAAEIYRQGIDIDTRNAQGIEPIQPILDQIDAIQDLDDFHAFQRTASSSWLTGLFWIFAYPDLADSSVNAAYLSGPFRGLPNRDYYLLDDESYVDVREAYLDVLAQLLGYIGYDEAEAAASAQAVFALERSLIAPTLNHEEAQDAALTYNPTAVAELAEIYPLMDWNAYLAALGLTGIDTIVVQQIRYLEALE